MKQNVRKNNFLLCAVIIMVFVALIFGLSTINQSAVAEETVIEVGEGVNANPTVVNKTITLSNGVEYRRVETAEDLVYALRTPGANYNYLLMHDFIITDPTWVNNNSENEISANFYGYVVDGNKIVEGQTRTLTFATSRPTSGGNLVYHKTKYGGLFGVFSGKLSNLTYRFSGRIEIKGDSYTDNELVINCGALAGTFKGTIENCNISSTGSIFVYSQRKSATAYVGGIAGQFLNGHINNSNINIGGSLSAANKIMNTEEDEKLDATNNKLVVGGIAAHTEQIGANIADVPYIKNSDIIIGAGISTNDECNKTVGGELGTGIIGGLPSWLNPSAACNADQYIFPAAGLFAEVSTIEIENSSINVSGSISSIGGYAASKNGAITGGLFGITNGGRITLNRNTISLFGKMVTRNESKEKIMSKVYHGVVYQGGIIGRVDGDIKGSFSNCVIEKNGNFYTETKAGECVTQHYGFIYGNSNDSLVAFNGGNIWIKGDVNGTKYNTNDSNYGIIHDIKSYGGGYLSHVINPDGQIIFKENQQFAPFYGWFTSDNNLRNNDKYTNSSEIINTTIHDQATNTNYNQSTYRPTRTKNSRTSIIAVFLTSEIYTAGNMVEFADEMNAGLNFNWIRVSMLSDITFTKGMPSINQFNGEFNGNNHTITFQADSTIVGSGDVAMFREITVNARFENVNIVFAGTVYAGNQDAANLDEATTAAVLVARNYGYIGNVSLELTQAGSIKSFGKSNVIGGLIGVNNAKLNNIALEQIDVTVDGKITAVGYDNVIGCVVGSSATEGVYEMINVFAKGEIVSSMNSTEQAATSRASMGGFAGELKAKLSTKNTVINVRDYSNYNNNVMMASCTHNKALCEELKLDMQELRTSVIKNEAENAKSLIEFILTDYFGEGGLGVAQRSQKDFENAKSKLRALSQSYDNGASVDSQITLVSEIISLVDSFDCSAQCSNCAANTKIFAIVGNNNNLSVGYNNTWVMGSYTQIPRAQSGNVGTNPLPYHSGNTTVEQAIGNGLNLLYVRDGSATCLMDISSKSADNIRFTVSVDTTKVFTGWYTTDDHSVMVNKDYIHGYETSDGIAQVLQPGEQTGMAVYSSVIDSLIVDSDIISKLATTTNAGQTYKGVKFVLGADITIQTHTVIGSSEENCFDGMIDGKGYSITIQGFAANQNYYGLFGVLGESSNIVQLNVIYDQGNLNLNNESGIFGGIAAINHGVIGQDSTSNKISVTIKNTVSGVRVAGGLVGINNGVVKNAEVYYRETGIGTRGNLTVHGFGSEIENTACIVGGAVAYNKEGLKTLVKNIIVYTECSYDRNITNFTAIATNGGTAYAGGLVGYNASRVYSSVVKVAYENATNSIVGECDYSALIIGYNAYDLTDGLWVLYSFDPTKGNFAYQTPSMEDGEFYFPLINGEGANNGNRLVKYGYGDIKVSIYSNNDAQPNGGSIVFEAVEMTPSGKTHAVPFYNYTLSMTAGGVVSSADGGSGQNFSPSITTTNKESLKGVNYYAVFVKTEISSENDFYDFIENINSGFQAYANYIIKLSAQSELNLYTSHERYQALDVNKEFVGNFNGNGCTIRLRSASDSMGNKLEGKAIFGIVSEHSSISNLEYYVESGTVFTTPTDYEGVSALGSFININKGVVDGVTFITSSTVLGDENVDYVGGFIGYNIGTASGIDVTFRYDNSQGIEYGGFVGGLVAGGVVGYNAGTVGSDRLDSVKIVVNSGNVESKIVGVDVVGGIIGINNGLAKNLNSKIYGRVSAANKGDGAFIINGNSYPLKDTKVGGVVGENQSRIESAVCYVYQSAKFSTTGAGSLGGVVGENNQGQIGKAGDKDSIKVYLYANVNSEGNSFGGIVGTTINSGIVTEGDVNLYGSVDGLSYAGGAVGVSSDSSLTNLTVYINTGAVLTGKNAVGGLVGRNNGTVSSTSVIIDGTVGSSLSSIVGGLFGNNQSTLVSDSFVIVRGLLLANEAGNIGLVSGKSVAVSNNEIVNVWGIASNSNTLSANGNAAVGFNTLKVVGKANVNAEFVENGRIKFTASYIQSSPTTWYSDISTLESFNASSNVYTAERDLKDVCYHVCYYDLIINNAQEFANIYQYVNDNDLFNGVMFKINSNDDIVITNTVNPIGTEEHPFAGIFDGDYSKIILERGGISGSDYCGIFGYLSDSAVIKNLVIEVKEDFIVGSGMSNYAGVLAGRLGGTITNVTVNALSAPYTLKSNAKVGALAGIVSEKTTLTDVWTVIYNGAVDAIGERINATNENKDDIVNTISVIGVGTLTASITTYGGRDVTFAVVGREDIDVFSFYDNWYSDISKRETIKSLANPNVYGTVDDRSNDGVIVYNTKGGLRENAGLSKVDFTLSFIDLVIRSAEDFYNFAQNINRYGDNGAMFSLDLGKDAGNNYIDELVIDVTKLIPIGTKEHPFTGVFDGLVNTSVSSSNACHTIRLVGNLSTDYNDYSGLFGYVGEGAIIKNLIVRADNKNENPDYQGQVFGDKKSIYTGYLAGYLQGEIKNVTVVLGDETELYNINEDSVGGLVGVMGDKASFVNAWLVLPEESTLRTVGGYKTASGDIYICDEQTVSTMLDGKLMPSLMYICGNGLFNVTFTRVDSSIAISDENSQFVFTPSALTDGEPVYGIIPKDAEVVENKLSELISKCSAPISGEKYLAVFLNPVIKTYEDLKKLAELTNSGRAYKGIEFYQVADITLPTVGFTPIGGQVSLSESLLGVEYKLVEFIGIYNGNGNKIIIPSSLTITDAYAGIFGILGEGARISNLYVEVQGTIGGDSTKYAGGLAGYDMGATLKNIIIELKKTSSINATLSTSRVAVNGAIKLDAYGNVINWGEVKTANNVWVLAYNNRFNNESNISEQAFLDSVRVDDTFKQEGVYNGGINVVTVVGAGELKLSFTLSGEKITGINIAKNSENGVKEWYRYVSGVKENFNDIPIDAGDVSLDSTYNSNILYASFLKSTIENDEDLITLAKDTNNGYDFYGLTFYLANDVIINNADYIGIGADIPFNATFDGQGNKITLASGTIIKGKYAGIFGNIGEYGKLKNVILQIDGQLGWNKYTAEQVQNGLENTLYAGAIAYIQGSIDSVIIIGTDALVDSETTDDGNNYGAIAFGYDSRNIMSNTWVITSADNLNRAIGYVSNQTESSINQMKLVGMGTLSVGFELINDKYVIKMENNYSEDSNYSIKGWYSNYLKDNQLSKALGVTENDTDVLAGDNGIYYPKTSLINRRYEVVIINTVITKLEQLLSIASDVNKGGYTYQNTSFSLGADIVIDGDEFTSIGTQSTHFKGDFSGYFNGQYYQITMKMSHTNPDGSKSPTSVPLFGYNEGIIENLSVVVGTDLSVSSGIVGVVASYNYGTVRGVLVSFDENVTVYGNKVGGIVAVNEPNAVVENSLVIIGETATLRGVVVGGLVAENNGYVVGSTGGDNSEFTVWEEERKDVLCGLTEFASVNLFGLIDIVNLDERLVAYGGGAVGVSQDLGSITAITVRLYSTARITANSKSFALGGVVGRSSATLMNSVCISDGKIDGVGSGDIGHFVGSIQGTATNSWLVVDVPTTNQAIGNGYQAVNILEVSGNGVIDAYIDGDNNIIFINITEEKSIGSSSIAQIDGWYESNGITVTDSIGNVDENTFKPLPNITGRTISVVFINLTITSVEDLNEMARTVNHGLFAKSLIFTLQNDLVITDENPLTDCIGIYTEDGAYGFKHVFEGNGHTITFAASADDKLPMLTQNYMGLFGYTSNSAVIQNLNVVYQKGVFGSVNTVAFGGISGYNSGDILNCNVTVDSAILIAQKVGGIVGVNTRLGNIQNTNVEIYGLMSAQSAVAADNSSPNAYVGGVVGLNAGTVQSATIRISGSLNATAHEGSAGATHAGGLSGSNSYYITNVNIELNSAKILATSYISAYAGGLTGSNMGTIDSAYIKTNGGVSITASSGIEQVSGGIVGANGTIITNVLIDISAETSVFDSAIGRDKANTSSITNVWVYNGSSAFNSKITAVNSMTYEMLNGNKNVSYNAVDDIVIKGEIVFSAMLDNEKGITVFAEAESDYASVLLFDSGFLSYVDNSLVFTSTNTVTGVHVRTTIRREFNDQTELKALSTALSSGVQLITGTYTLGNDIVITDKFTAIGDENHYFTANLVGNYHNITFAKSEVDGIEKAVEYGNELHSLFGYISGTIEKLSVTYQYSLDSDNSAGIAVHNNGRIVNSVIYTEQDVSLLNVVATGTSVNENVWIISRVPSNGDSMTGSNVSTNKYGSIVINGKGSLVIDTTKTNLTFNPVPQTEQTTFIGFAGENDKHINAILSNDPFDTTSDLYYGGHTFSAEFISSVISDKADLMALISVLELNYRDFSREAKFEMAGDVTVNVNEILAIKEFLGTFEGKNHVITLIGTSENGVVFGESKGSESARFKNLTFDVTDWIKYVQGEDENAMYLLDMNYAGNFENVSVIFATKDLRLSDLYNNQVAWTATNVYAVTNNAPYKNDFATYTTSGIGLIEYVGALAPGFYTDENGKYFATSYENEESEIFIGWYKGNFTTDYTYEFSGSTSNVIELTEEYKYYKNDILYNSIYDSQELAALQSAVSNGFEMQDKVIEICEDLIDVNYSIGTDKFTFKGTINGNGYNISCEKSLFKGFDGRIINAIIDIGENQAFAESISENASFENVVLVSEATDAGYAINDNLGTFTNCWIIATTTNETKVNVLTRNPDEVGFGCFIDTVTNSVDVSVSSNYIDKFVVWNDQEGNVLVNESYDTVQTVVGELKRYNAVITNTIASLDELKVFALAVKYSEFTSPVSLITDITIDDSFKPIDNSESIFYGNGHTITVENLSGNFTMFTNLNQKVYDLKLSAGADQNVEIADATSAKAGLVNCVIELNGNASATLRGNLNNSWIVKKVDTGSYSEFVNSCGETTANVLAYRIGKVESVINAETKSVLFRFAPSDELVTLGFVDGVDLVNEYISTYTEVEGENVTGRRVLGYSASKYISSEADWNSLVNAVNETGNDLSGLEFILTNDLHLTSVVDGNIEYLRKLEAIQGTINGDFNSIIIDVRNANDEKVNIADDYTGFLSFAGVGKAINLAVEVFTECATVLDQANENCWVISYVGDISTSAGLIKVVNKAGRNSKITVNEKNGSFDFFTNDEDEYKLYHWFDLNYYIEGDNENNKTHILSLENGTFKSGETVVNNVVAEYQECYTIYVDVIDPITNLPITGIRPDVNENDTYFPVEVNYLDIEANLTEGYVFWGFAYDDIYSAISYDRNVDFKKLSIPDMSKLKGSIRIKAYYSLLSVDFANITYGDLSSKEINEYLVLTKSQRDYLDVINEGLDENKLFTISRTLVNDSSTMPLVYDVALDKYLPKHAGNYEVTYSISGGATQIGLATFNFSIKPKKLSFIDLVAKSKVYDTDSTTTIVSKLLYGFVGEDNQENKISTLDFSNVKLVYVDPTTGEAVSKAGSGYNVMITEDSYLDSLSNEYFFNIDYALPKGKILHRHTIVDGELVELEPFTFGIEKANLTISVPTITIEYLDQFKVDENGYFDIKEIFKNYYTVEGLKESDDILKNVNLLIVAGDEIVSENGEQRYVYHIKNAGSYALNPVNGALENYNINMSTSTARLRIVQSKVSPIIGELSVQYGNPIETLPYTLSVNGIVNESSYQGFAEHFKLNMDYAGFVQRYMALDLKVDYVYDTVSTDAVVAVPRAEKYGIAYRFLQSDNFVYDEQADSKFEYVNNVKEFILTVDSVLTVTKRSIVIEYTGESSKIFASPDADFSSSVRTVGVKLVNDDKLTVTRNNAGTPTAEKVGQYPLLFKVLDGNSNDVTAYYSISYKNGEGYSYEIKVRNVKVSHLGSSYYYGDTFALQNMKYSTNLSQKVLASITSIFGKGNEKSLEDLGIVLKVGYFGSERLNVGSYNCEFSFNAGDNIKECLNFVLDTKNCLFTIIPQRLTIETENVQRMYDKSNDITFSTLGSHFTVTGFVGDDSKYLEVIASGFEGDVNANAGTYLYRPSQCTLVCKRGHGDKANLLDNYVIDKVKDGKYTILPIEVELGVDLGYYNEDGSFVSTDGEYYFGDMSARLHFYLVKNLTGYLNDLYTSEVSSEATEKEESEWLIKTLNITHKALSTFNPDNLDTSSIKVDKTNNNLYLRSDDANIKIVTSCFFYVKKVYYVIKDFKFVIENGELTANATIEAIDDMDEAIEHYEFNNSIKGLKPNENFALSDSVALSYSVEGDVENNMATFKLGLKYNTVGSWSTPEDDLIYFMNENGERQEHYSEDSRSANVEVIYSDSEKIVNFIKENPVLFALAIIGIILSIVGISLLSVAIYRNKRITKAAWREIQYGDKLQQGEESQENDENSNENE